MEQNATEALTLILREQKGPLRSIIGGVWSVLKDKIGNVDLSSMSEEMFIGIVGKAYDTLVEPIDLPGDDKILDPLLKGFVIYLAREYYKHRNSPASAGGTVMQ